MSKARDLANAGTALTTVSATELGYLDGVTSAVQTQINAKQATVSGVNDTEIGYLDGVTSAIQTQINAQIPKSTVTTKGDILVATGSGTIVRQGVGTDGQVLVADSAQADGVNWATPSAGGMTLISETTASALSTLSLSSIPQTYKQLVLVWNGIFHSLDTTAFQMRFNNVSTSTYYRGQMGARGGTFDAGSGAISWADVGDTDNASFGFKILAANGASGFARGYLIIDNYASTTKFKTYTMNYSYNRSDGSIVRYINGTFANTAAITSIDIIRANGTGTFSNETNTSIRLYGIS
jgi:hypothetical protein